MALAMPLTATSTRPVPNTTANALWFQGQQVAVKEYSDQLYKLSLGKSLHGKLVNFPPRAQEAVKSGNIEALRFELSQGSVVVDQTKPEGNLLDFVIVWITQVLKTGNPVTGRFYVSPAKIAQMGLYLISCGLAASPQAMVDFEPPWLDLVAIPPEDVESLGNFLATINQGQMPIQRILRTFSFAVAYRGQLSVSESFDANIGRIDGGVDLGDLIRDITQETEEGYWAKDNLFASGLEAVIVNALLKYEWEKRVRGLPVEEETLDSILQGPRTLLMRLFLHVPRVPNAAKLLSNVIGLCRPLPLLLGEFGDIMAMFALRHEALGTWITFLERHRMTSQYLHSEGLKHSLSGPIQDWEMIGDDVRNPFSNVYKLHWRTVRKSSLRRDFQDVLKPYVRAADSEELYAECKIFTEVEF